jgi:TetR/AcrR family transcriptional regulator, repressor for lfrA
MSHADVTRRRLLDTAAGVLCANSGASLTDVAEAAGVGRTTLHRHFPTRHALLYALADDALVRVEEAVGKALVGADEPVESSFTRLAEAVLPLADELRFLDIGAGVWDLPEMVERWYDLSRPVEDLVRRAKDSGALRLDLPTAWVVDLFVGAVFAASSGVSDGRIARRDAVELVVDSVLHGIVTPGGPR